MAPGVLTRRRVAEVAGVSLTVTTYYYANKFEMIADAQARLLDDYVRTFRGLHWRLDDKRRATQ